MSIRNTATIIYKLQTEVQYTIFKKFRNYIEFPDLGDLENLYNLCYRNAAFGSLQSKVHLLYLNVEPHHLLAVSWKSSKRKVLLLKLLL